MLFAALSALFRCPLMQKRSVSAKLLDAIDVNGGTAAEEPLVPLIYSPLAYTNESKKHTCA